MKKQNQALLSVFACIGIFLISCNESKNTGNLVFEKVQFNKTTHLFGDTAKPGCNLTIDYTYSIKSSDARLQDSLNAYFIAACLGEKYIHMNPQEAIDLYHQKYAHEYRNDLEPMYMEDLKNKESKENVLSWYSYYRGIESNIQFYEKDLLVYRIDYNEYTGGAHGTYSSTFLNMDLKNSSKLSLDDLFIGDYEEGLVELLWKQLMKDNDTTTKEQLEEMGYGLTGDLIPTENFFLDKEGITFYYNIYEFTPYVMGATEIKLPFNEVLHMIGSNPIIGQLRK